jgi:hypothetical protein
MPVNYTGVLVQNKFSEIKQNSNGKTFVRLGYVVSEDKKNPANTVWGSFNLYGNKDVLMAFMSEKARLVRVPVTASIVNDRPNLTGHVSYAFIWNKQADGWVSARDPLAFGVNSPL